ncbi:MAG: 5'-nucleotidase C-terminal domain-containing protein [Defluviitaleaceae bacterium]|nr:5'-nucleotidase C-terminal domain-containing protein [Defluviitaleaceae bacterium]
MKFRNKILSFLTFTVISITNVYASELPDGATTVRIVHTNDLHGRLVQTNNIIGLDTVASIYQATENAILVDAGDTIHGLPFVNFNQGANAIRLMNEAGFRVFTPGNHDFNYGADKLLEFEQIADFDFLSANIYNEDGSSVFRPYSIHEVDGFNIGFFGLAYPDTPSVTNPRNVEGLNFTNPVEAARTAVESLQNHGVDIIVGISHLGFNGNAWGRQVAEQVEGIDILIDGHSHTLLENGEWVNDTLVAQVGAHGTHVGIVEITIYNDEIIDRVATVINREVAEEFEAVASITNSIEELSSELDEILDVVVAYSPITFYGDSENHRIYLRSQEVPIGNLVADAKRWYTGANLALTNSGGIRTHINQGPVTQGDIIAVLAFFNYAVVVEVTPAILWQAVENGVAALPGSGRFPHISGFRFEFDENMPEGQRVHTLQLEDGTNLDQFDNETIFTLAINDFMHAGGDSYDMFVPLESISQHSTQDQILIAYMNEHDISNIGVEGRIVRSERVNNVIEIIEISEITQLINMKQIEFLPLRETLNSIGITNIVWDEVSRTITINDNVIITIDSNIAIVANEQIEILAPVIINDVTHIDTNFINLLSN